MLIDFNSIQKWTADWYILKVQICRKWEDNERLSFVDHVYLRIGNLTLTERHVQLCLSRTLAAFVVVERRSVLCRLIGHVPALVDYSAHIDGSSADFFAGQNLRNAERSGSNRNRFSSWWRETLGSQLQLPPLQRVQLVEALDYSQQKVVRGVTWKIGFILKFFSFHILFFINFLFEYKLETLSRLHLMIILLISCSLLSTSCVM